MSWNDWAWMKGGEEALGAEGLSGKECFLRKEESSTYSPNLDPQRGWGEGERRELMDHRFWVKAYCLGRESCKSGGKSCFSELEVDDKLLQDHRQGHNTEVRKRSSSKFSRKVGWSCYVRRTGASVAQQYFLAEQNRFRTMWCWHSVVLASRSGKWYE